jgi:hypothetical protein
MGSTDWIFAVVGWLVFGAGAVWLLAAGYGCAGVRAYQREGMPP